MSKRLKNTAKEVDSTSASKTTKPTNTTLKKYLVERGRELRLVDANERLARELARAKGHTADLVEAVQRALKDAVTGLVIPPVPVPTKERRRVGDGEKAVVVVSDVQLAKTTPSYSTAIAEKRLAQYAEKVVALTEIQRHDHPVNEARVYLLGDIVEGEMIFPSQPHQIDASLYRQVAVDGPRILVNFLRTLLTSFTRVHVVGVIGNHGALGGPVRRQYNPETNADRMLYQFVRELLRDEPRLTWNIPFETNERAWYAVDTPYEGQGFLLYHGDQLPGTANYSVGTLAKYLWGLASGAVPEPFKYAINGHYHTPRRFVLNNITSWQNGSTESSNRYAQERLAAVGEPTQLLLFVHPRKGVSAEYWVHLD